MDWVGYFAKQLQQRSPHNGSASHGALQMQQTQPVFNSSKSNVHYTAHISSPPQTTVATTYTDLRPLFIRGLCVQERKLAATAPSSEALPGIRKAIVALSLYNAQLTSTAEAEKFVEGISDTIASRLNRIIDEATDRMRAQPMHGKFVCAAPAFLVALLNITDELVCAAEGVLSVAMDRLVPANLLKLRARQLTEERFVDNDDDNNKENISTNRLGGSRTQLPTRGPLCLAMYRLSTLETMGYVKSTVRGRTEPVYELTEKGEAIALELRDSLLQMRTLDQSSSQMARAIPTIEHIRTTNLSDTVMNQTVGLADIILVVDKYECGGESARGLEKLRHGLAMQGIPHRLEELGSGLADYIWLQRIPGSGEFMLPFVCERKTVPDLARSLEDGRYDGQKHLMRALKQSYGIHTIIYIVEGKNPEKMPCRCGCRGVGKCGGATVEQVRAAIRELEADPLLEYHRFPSNSVTLNFFVERTRQLQRLVGSGAVRNIGRTFEEIRLRITGRWRSPADIQNPLLEEKIAAVQAVLPSVSRELIEAQLSVPPHDVNAVVMALLEMRRDLATAVGSDAPRRVADTGVLDLTMH